MIGYPLQQPAIPKSQELCLLCAHPTRTTGQLSPGLYAPIHTGPNSHLSTRGAGHKKAGSAPPKPTCASADAITQLQHPLEQPQGDEPRLGAAVTVRCTEQLSPHAIIRSSTSPLPQLGGHGQSQVIRLSAYSNRRCSWAPTTDHQPHRWTACTVPVHTSTAAAQPQGAGSGLRAARVPALPGTGLTSPPQRLVTGTVSLQEGRQVPPATNHSFREKRGQKRWDSKGCGSLSILKPSHLHEPQQPTLFTVR